MTGIAVIIPYFQRETGVLRRALTSILEQKLPDGVGVHIIVVDDASPIPAESEIEGLQFQAPLSLSIEKQANQGVAGARNTGLNVARNKKHTYIAFLDSDDIWSPNHLKMAIESLDHGYDYYFCDHTRIGHHESYFKSIAFDPVAAHTAKPTSTRDVYETDKQSFFQFFLRVFVSQISTVVCRLSSLKELTFDSSLHAAGEDHLFLLRLTLNSQKICYSPTVQVTCGDGVNIYAGRYSWSDTGHLIRHMGIILALYKFKQSLPLSGEDAAYLKKRIRLFHTAFAFLSVRYFLKKRELWPQELVKMTRADPCFLCWYPLHFLFVAILYPLGLYSPLRE